MIDALLMLLAASQTAICPVGDRDLRPGPRDVCIGRENNDYSFAVLYPAAADPIPALRQILRRDAAASERRTIAAAAEFRRERGSDSGERIPMSHEQQWTADADRPELLALSSAATFYLGGAHGGFRYHSILWDRRGGRQIRFLQLFGDQRSAARLLTRQFCPALRAAQRERLGNEYSEVSLLPCPDIANQPITMRTDSSGRIQGFTVLLAPYVAGSWAEGPYEVELPLTGALRRLILPRYAPAFAAGS